MGNCFKKTKEVTKEVLPAVDQLVQGMKELLEIHTVSSQKQIDQVNEKLEKVMVSCTPVDRHKLVEIAKMNNDLLVKHKALEQQCKDLGVRASQIISKKTYDISEKKNLDDQVIIDITR